MINEIELFVCDTCGAVSPVVADKICVCMACEKLMKIVKFLRQNEIELFVCDVCDIAVPADSNPIPVICMECNERMQRVKFTKQEKESNS